MEVTSVERQGGDYIVKWPHLSMRFRKLHAHSEGYTATMTAVTEGMPQSGIMYNSRLQLEGPRAKKDCAKACAERAPDVSWDWVALVEEACALVIRALEEGEPILDLSDEAEIQEEAPWLIPGLLRLGEHVVLHGMGGEGKSLLGLLIAMKLAWPETPLFGEGMFAHPCILDYEDEASTHRLRLSRLATGLELPRIPTVLYKRAEASLPMMAESLARQIDQDGINFLIIDSAALACGADPEKAETATAYFRALRGLRLAAGSLTIAHQTKTAEPGKADFPFGSVFWWNSPRAVWKQIGKRTENSPTLHLGLWQKKANNNDFQRPIGLSIHFEADRYRVTTQDVRYIAEFRSELTARQRIVSILREQTIIMKDGMEREALWSDLSSVLSRQNFTVTLKRMLDAGEITEQRGRLWIAYSS